MIDFHAEYCDLVDWSLDQFLSGAYSIDLIFRADKEVVSYIQGKNLRGYFSAHKNEFLLRREMVERKWRGVEERWNKYLTSIWSYQNCKTIHAYFTIFNLFPRDLGQRTFLYPYTDDISRIVSVIAHEAIHFVFFDLLGNYNPDRELWLVSELIVPLVFKHVNEERILQGVTCSNYCLSSKAIERAFPVYMRFVNKELEFKEFVSDLQHIVKECGL